MKRDEKRIRAAANYKLDSVLTEEDHSPVGTAPIQPAGNGEGYWVTFMIFVTNDEVDRYVGPDDPDFVVPRGDDGDDDPEADYPTGYDPDEDRSPDSFDPPDRDEKGEW